MQKVPRYLYLVIHKNVISRFALFLRSFPIVWLFSVDQFWIIFYQFQKQPFLFRIACIINNRCLIADNSVLYLLATYEVIKQQLCSRILQN